MNLLLLILVRLTSNIEKHKKKSTDHVYTPIQYNQALIIVRYILSFVGWNIFNFKMSKDVPFRLSW